MARILSIDDDSELQQMLSLALQGEGHELHYAFTGREGYDKVLLLNPDLILTDLMLPFLNGVEMIKLIKANKIARDIPIVVMTSFHENAKFLENVVRPLGVIEYLRKPVNIDELCRLIKRLLRGRADRTPLGFRLHKGAVRLDPKYRSVWIDDKLVATLAPKRFDVIMALVDSRSEITAVELLKRVWADGSENRNTLEKTVQRLREDLGPEAAQRIRTTTDGYELIG